MAEAARGAARSPAPETNRPFSFARATLEAAPREPEATARERPRNAEPPPTLRIPRVSRPPKVEEFLQGKPRLAGAWIMDFRQREPGDGVQASKETSAYLSYDHKNLYVVV